MTKMQDPIEKLREYAAECCPEYEQYDSYMMRLADEIEAAYIKLPVDADGIPIKPGELLLHGNSGAKRLVESIVLHEDGGAVARTETGGVLMCHECRHVKHDTVESLLQELADEVWNASCESQTTWSDSGLDGIAERYAESIRKAVEHGEDS